MSNLSFVCLFQSLLNLFFEQLLYKANMWHANQMSHILSILDCQDIYIGTKAARWGGPWIRIKSGRSTIQNWRLKIEHVQRIKVDRDDSPILVEWTLEPPVSQFTCLLSICKNVLKTNTKVFPTKYKSPSKSISNSTSKSISKITPISISKSISKFELSGTIGQQLSHLPPNCKPVWQCTNFQSRIFTNRIHWGKTSLNSQKGQFYPT